MARFRRWTDDLGAAKAAEVLRCSPSFVSHMRAGRKKPSLDLAVRIERASQGRVRAVDWIPVEHSERSEQEHVAA